MTSDILNLNYGAEISSFYTVSSSLEHSACAGLDPAPTHCAVKVRSASAASSLPDRSSATTSGLLVTTVNGLAASPPSRSWAAASNRADTTLALGGWSRSHSGMNLDEADRILRI